MPVLRHCVFVLLCLVVLVPANLQAAVVQNIYEAEVTVNGQDRRERHRAVRAGLVTVLIKATGNREVALSPGVPELLKRSLQFLQQYRYRSELRPDTAGGEPLERQLIWLRYDARAIDRALRDIGLAVWPKTRPTTLVWLAIEENRQRRLYTEADVFIRETIEREARHRSIPVTLPLMDLEDQRRLDVADIWANFQESIMNASRRYAPEGVLVGRLQAGTSQWQARWSYYKDGRAWDWTVQGSLEDVLGGGIDGTVDVLARDIINSAPPNEQGAVRVLVRNINSIDDYARSNAYLHSLDTVLDVQASQVEQDRVVFNLVLRGNTDDLKRAIQLSDHRILREGDVEPVLQPTQQAAAPRPDLVYKLLP